MALTNIVRTETVWGNKRVILLALDIGADADEYDTGYHKVEAASVSSVTNNAIGWDSANAGKIRFQTGGAENNAHAIIICPS